MKLTPGIAALKKNGKDRQISPRPPCMPFKKQNNAFIIFLNQIPHSGLFAYLYVEVKYSYLRRTFKLCINNWELERPSIYNSFEKESSQIIVYSFFY